MTHASTARPGRAKKAAKQRYARLMGDFWRHPRTSALTPMAAGVLARAWSYCADQMTDGDVPRAIVAAFFGGAVDETIVEELVGADLWKPTRSGYRMRGWSDRNITRSEWEEKKTAAAKRVQKHREKAPVPAEPVEKRNDLADLQEPCNALHDALPTRYERSCNDPATHDEGRRTKDEDPLPSEEVPRVADAAGGGRSEHPSEMLRSIWRAAWAEARENRDEPTDIAGSAEPAAWIVDRAKRAGVEWEPLMRAVVTAYWREDWPRSQRANPRFPNLHRFLPKLADTALEEMAAATRKARKATEPDRFFRWIDGHTLRAKVIDRVTDEEWFADEAAPQSAIEAGYEPRRKRAA